ncbi:hypothetical protein FHP29_20090 [Nocardioides albidus]|uniref:Uncharacterized protein n=1 Tax=Nocardioides albidus TaxID=1517589 RepID=A0A5C4VKW7_9ACTN|nr:hypothetical protein FHP29_20090 [Nocardioides albidus]
MPGDPEPSPQGPQGPGDFADPVPQPDPNPEGPGDITNPEPGDDPGPQIPGDKDGPNPGDGPRPEGPGDIAIPDPGDKPDNPGDGGGKADHPEPDHKGGHKAGHKKHPKPAAQPQVEAQSDAVPVPTRIDAGAGATEEGGLELSWLLASGGIVTAAGSALAGRRLVRSRR